MRQKRPFRTSAAPWWRPTATPDDATASQTGDPARPSDDTPLERLRPSGAPSRTPARGTPKGRGAREGLGVLVADDEEAETLQRVGGRRHVRRDLLALALGGVFVAVMLAKPWNALGTGGPQTSPPAFSPPPTSAIAAVTATPPAEANGRVPASGPRETQDGSVARAAAATAAYAAKSVFDAISSTYLNVNWTALAATVDRDGWGIATASLPVGPRNLTHHPALRVTWVSANPATPDKPVEIQLLPAQDVFAVAVTWPRGKSIVNVAFEYLGPADHTSYPNAPSDGSGIGPYSWFSVLPVDDLGITPAATSVPIPSGRFWAGPFEPTADASIVSASWQHDPWPWLHGAYRVLLTGEDGKTYSFFLDLVP